MDNGIAKAGTSSSPPENPPRDDDEVPTGNPNLRLIPPSTEDLECEGSGESQGDGKRPKRAYTKRKTPKVTVTDTAVMAENALLRGRLETMEMERRDILAELRALRRLERQRSTESRTQLRGSVEDGVYRRSGETPPPRDPPPPSSRRASSTRAGERSHDSHKSFESLRRWGIDFSGKRSEDVYEFVSRVDDALTAFPHLEEADVLTALRGLLAGCARQWYREYEFTSWRTARKAFLTRFSDPDYQLALQEEISGRTQGEKEPMSEFLAKMRSLFGRSVEPWTESRQVRCCHRNMLPRYRVNIALREDMTFEELESEAIRKEQAFIGARRWRPPPRADESLCPSLAYHEPPGAAKEKRSYLHQLGEDPYEHPNDEVDADENQWETEVLNLLRSRKFGNRPRNQFSPSDKPNATTDRVCWNCYKKGHSHQDCKAAEKRIFCYRCGYPEVTSPNCPRCNSGNEATGV